MVRLPPLALPSLVQSKIAFPILQLPGVIGATVFDPLVTNGVPSVALDGRQSLYSDLGITLCVNNDPVEQWNDLSGHGNNVSQATLANRPTYLAAGWPNGLPCLSFNGTSSRLLRATFTQGTLAQPTTIFVVAKSSSIAAGSREIIDGSGGTFRNVIRQNGSTWSIGSTTFIGGGTSDTNPHVLCGQFSSPNCFLRVDGSQILSGDSGSSSMVGILIGTNSSISALWNGLIAAVYIYPAALSISQIQPMEAYLKGVWGTP